MLDTQFIRENPELVQKKTKEKGYNIDIAAFLEIDLERRSLQQQVDELRARRNENASKMKTINGGAKPSKELIDEGKEIKVLLAERERYLSETENAWRAELQSIPNITKDDVPIGDESASVEVGVFGGRQTGAIDHLDLATAREWVDFERGAKVAGTKFYFLKGDLALLENALIQFALDFVIRNGFTYMTVPHMVSSKIATGTGFAPRTDDQSDEYFIEGEDLSLIATAEMSLTGYHADEILNEDDLPKLYAGLSPCYRKDAGAAG